MRDTSAVPKARAGFMAAPVNGPPIMMSSATVNPIAKPAMGFIWLRASIAASARTLAGERICFVGVGLPNIVCNLAQRTVAPDLQLVYEAGVFGARPSRLPLSIGLFVLLGVAASADALPLRPAIEILTGLTVEPIICPPAFIAEGLERFYPGELEPGILFRAVGDHQMSLFEPERGPGAGTPDRLTPAAPPSAWLRGILAEAVRRRAQRLEIVPRGEGTDIVLACREGRALARTLPRGPYAGIAALLEGLARIAARGRVKRAVHSARDTKATRRRRSRALAIRGACACFRTSIRRWAVPR